MAPIRSIEGRLLIAIACAGLILSAATGVFLYRSLATQYRREFDNALRTQAQALCSLVTIQPNGSLDFEYNGKSMPEYQRTEHSEYFAVRMTSEKPFMSSATLKGTDLPHGLIDDVAQDLTLPSGALGRVMQVQFIPQPEDDPGHPLSATAPVHPQPTLMRVVVARERMPLDLALTRAARTLVSATALLAGALIIVSGLIIRASLRSLRVVADRAEQIDPSRLHLRFETAGLPAELSPICLRLNDLLERLDRAFRRERRFTADVAHELRTPVAELRSITEVAMRWPGDDGLSREAIQDAHEIAKQLQTLIATLLSLVRSESGLETGAVKLDAVTLRLAVDRVVRERQRGEEGHDLPIVVNVPEDAIVPAEPALLLAVLQNVIANALEYRDADAPVTIEAQRADERWTLTICNRNSTLMPEDVAHLFDPFWRKDAARTGTEHAGLGLSLVASYCRMMGIELHADITQPSLFRLQLTFSTSRNLQSPAPATATADVV